MDNLLLGILDCLVCCSSILIGSISKGRTIRQVIIGGYAFGAGSTILSFIILGNYSMGLEMKGMANFLAEYQTTGDIYILITNIIRTLPFSSVIFSFGITYNDSILCNIF